MKMAEMAKRDDGTSGNTLEDLEDIDAGIPACLALIAELLDWGRACKDDEDIKGWALHLGEWRLIAGRLGMLLEREGYSPPLLVTSPHLTGLDTLLEWQQFLQKIGPFTNLQWVRVSEMAAHLNWERKQI